MATTFTAEQVTKFEHLLELESNLRGEKVGMGFRPTGTPAWRLEQMHKALKRAEAALFAAIGELSPEEGALYGKYRAAFYAEVEAMAAARRARLA